MARWFLETGSPVVFVANKCDKVKKTQLAGNLAEIRATLALPERAEVLPFSAETGEGRGALLGRIETAAKGGARAE
jgi:GTP-binding protein